MNGRMRLTCVFGALLTLPRFAFACPNQCTCTPRTVICTCGEFADGITSGEERHLEIANLAEDMDEIGTMIIHSCSRVTIHNDSFAGVRMIEELKLLNIRRIDIYPHAFRDIAKSPRQLILQDSRIRTIPSFAFTGLSNLEHLWLRNMTIGRIAKMAFAHVSNVTYFYFRNCVVRTVDAGAFVHLDGIEFFYMRGDISLPSVGGHIFVGSFIEELVFEGVHIHATDLTLVGVSAKRIHVIGCKWHAQKAQIKKIPSQRVHEFVVSNSTMNRLVLPLYYNYSSVEFDHCEIGHIHATPSIIAENIGRLQFRHCSIGNWHPYALSSGRRIGAIFIENSNIGTIHHRAIYDTSLVALKLTSTFVRATATRAFESNRIGNVDLMDVESGRLSKELFHLSTFSNFSIIRSLMTVESSTFANITVKDGFRIVQSTFDYFPAFLFHGSKVKSLLVANSRVGKVLPQVFHGLLAKQLHMRGCEFHCDATTDEECEMNALLTTTKFHTVAWTFSDNYCTAGTTTKTCETDTRNESQRSLVCKRQAYIEECICSNVADAVLLPATSATVLTLGDCARSDITVRARNSSNLQFLYLYRIGRLTVQSIDPTVREIHILYSNVYFNNNLHKRRKPLEVLSLKGSFLGISTPTLSDIHVDLVSMNDSAVQVTTATPFAEAHIGRLTMTRTAVISSGDLFRHTRNVVMDDSWIQESGFSSNASLCYRNVTFNCDCWDPTAVAPNICEDEYSKCQDGEPLPATKVHSRSCYEADATSLQSSSAGYKPLVCPISSSCLYVVAALLLQLCA